ncbi:hypothetical protein HZS55_04290 [Halosimplex rubrum]|uniref:Uncharacterized protein n=1 Tax=Halosimplex rubrum TaxID=869889 RepID=A0A7D5SWF9_9EURY|nr:hypothetical protein [Halosimplex rubrum]QLH76571.1 hypothetical protein HZS55_04290 [Halosimplex rubrum]
MTDTKEAIKEGYESRDTGLLNTGSLSATDIKEGLRDLANDEFSEFEKLRNGAYYYDPFGLPEGTSVTGELKHLFKRKLVVNTQDIQSQFDIAPADVDFFAERLVDQQYISRISTGDRDYYRSGPDLRDETSGDASVSARLEKEATLGTLSHSKLENVIDVAATSDVIRHLVNEGFVVDMGDDYLVRSCFDEYAEFLVDEIGDDVVDEFDDIGVLTLDEFEQVVENEISERYDVLLHLDRNDTEQLFDEIRGQLKEEYGLTEDKAVIRHEEDFEEYVDARADQILEDIDQQALGQPSDLVDEGRPQIAEIVVSDAERVNGYVRDAIEERFERKVDAMFQVGNKSTE